MGGPDRLLARVGRLAEPYDREDSESLLRAREDAARSGAIRGGSCRGTRDVACAGGRSRTAVERWFH